jgi:hypothetical protein
MRRERPPAMQVAAVISCAAWVWSWYTMYLEIHRWKHVTARSGSTRHRRSRAPASSPGPDIR